MGTQKDNTHVYKKGRWGHFVVGSRVRRIVVAGRTDRQADGIVNGRTRVDCTRTNSKGK